MKPISLSSLTKFTMFEVIDKPSKLTFGFPIFKINQLTCKTTTSISSVVTIKVSQHRTQGISLWEEDQVSSKAKTFYSPLLVHSLSAIKLHLTNESEHSLHPCYLNNSTNLIKSYHNHIWCWLCNTIHFHNAFIAEL